MLTATNRDQLRNPTLGNGVWATFTFFTCQVSFGFDLPLVGTAEEPARIRAAVQVRHSAVRQYGDEPDDALPGHLRLHEEVQQGERHRGCQGRQRRVGTGCAKTTAHHTHGHNSVKS